MYQRILTDNEIERIYQGAIRVLRHNGFRIQDAELIERLARRGARTDSSAQVFWPDETMVRDLEDCARRNARRVESDIVLRRPLPTGESISYNGTLYYDAETGTRRAAGLADIETTLQGCHVLPELTRVGPAMTAQDVPPPLEPIVSLALAIQTTDKPINRVELILGEQLPYLEALDSIAQGREVRYDYDGCAPSSFTVDARAAGCLLATWRRNGLTRWVTSSCPIAGASAPVTLAGSVVVGVAETIGAWFAGWVLNEDVSLGAIPCSGVMDMHTTRALFSAPESVLIDVGIYQVLDRMLGVQPGMLADYTDAKIPGMQAFNDKLFKSLSYALLTGQLNTQRGTLEAGKAFSPVQMIMDFEINRELAQLAHGMEVSDDALALDLIEELAADFAPSFLGAEHTARHFRKTLWHARLMDRSAWESSEVERQKERLMLDEATARWHDAVHRYRRPDISDQKLRAVDEVVRSARAALM